MDRDSLLVLESQVISNNVSALLWSSCYDPCCDMCLVTGPFVGRAIETHVIQFDPLQRSYKQRGGLLCLFTSLTPPGRSNFNFNFNFTYACWALPLDLSLG